MVYSCEEGFINQAKFVGRESERERATFFFSISLETPNSYVVAWSDIDILMILASENIQTLAKLGHETLLEMPARWLRCP